MTVNAPTTALEALDVARSQLGVTEQPPGSNRNPYGAWYGMNGVAWCDEFFSWTDWKAGWADAPKFAATTVHAAWFQRNGAWLPASATPPEGAAIFYDWGQGIAHIGRWEGLLPDGRISSLEGNTDSAAGASGGRVMRQYRSRALIAGFGVITYQEDGIDMPYIAQLTADLTYQGEKFPGGYAVEVIGQARHHISADQYNARVKNGRKVLPMDPNEMTDLFDMTVTDIHRLLKG